MAVANRYLPPALIIGHAYRGALATARSLGRSRIPYRVLERGDRDLTQRSRHTRRHGIRRVDLADAEQLVAATSDIIHEHRIGIVIPTDDFALSALSEHRDALAPAKLCAGPTESVRNVLDKRSHLELAAALDVPCPRSYTPRDAHDTARAASELGFPMVLKNPGFTTDASQSRWGLKWIVVNDEAELRRGLAEHEVDGDFPILQEHVDGKVIAVCCFAVEGELSAAHSFVRLRSYLGEATYRKGIPLDHDLARHSGRLLRELRWDGPAILSFKLGGDGQPRYMEMNGRLWGSVECSIHDGWDFPRWTYDYFSRGIRPRPPQEDQAIGRASCWRFGDLMALLTVLKDRQAFQASTRVPVLAVLDYIAAFRPGVHADVFRWDDPAPELYEHWRWLQRMARRLRGGGAVTQPKGDR